MKPMIEEITMFRLLSSSLDATGTYWNGCAHWPGATASAARSMANFEIYDRDLKFGVPDSDRFCWCRGKILHLASDLPRPGRRAEHFYHFPPEMAIFGDPHFVDKAR
jgi:hypothetical protein